MICCSSSWRASRELGSASRIVVIPFALDLTGQHRGAYYTPLQVLQRGEPLRAQIRPFRPPLVVRHASQLWHGSCRRSSSIASRGMPGMTNAVMGLRLKQQLTLTPRLQQSVKLLQLSALECVQELHQAIAQNPFLEEPADCTVTRTQSEDGSAEGSSEDTSRSDLD